MSSQKVPWSFHAMSVNCEHHLPENQAAATPWPILEVEKLMRGSNKVLKVWTVGVMNMKFFTSFCEIFQYHLHLKSPSLFPSSVGPSWLILSEWVYTGQERLSCHSRLTPALTKVMAALVSRAMTFLTLLLDCGHLLGISYATMEEYT